jgi:hypothetical protein
MVFRENKLLLDESKLSLTSAEVELSFDGRGLELIRGASLLNRKGM